MTAPVVTRFAPSPTGLLHRGHAFSALTAYETARAAGGRFLLRIEDIDATRRRAEFDAAILEDLAWLGLTWEAPVWRQSQRHAVYGAALDRLRDRGLLYRCFRSRREIYEDIGRAPHGPLDGVRPGPHPPPEEGRLLNQGLPFAWRLNLGEALRAMPVERLTFVEEGEGPSGERGLIVADVESSGDVVLARKDVGFSYHLAVVVDDAAQGVTDVVRGRDLFASTPVQRLLQALLGLPEPVYRHHRLILRPDGKRFAKRDSAETLRDIRARGVTPQALMAELTF